jgi:murein DD-endopeptidase MepM/ murein hydrolase activator NlpD
VNYSASCPAIIPRLLKYMRLIFVWFLVLICLGLSAQYDFRSPIDAEIKLAANFGELRDNHFHSGLDIRTDGKEGWNIYAVGDGYVSRILMSRKGYGNALYIDHPNGLTSVYGHLSGYNKEIRDFATASQYLHEDFELDTMLLPNAIPVKKGDIVAYSGNTGGSTGPHLHFEIRDTKTEFILNPENFGFEIHDHIPPKVFSVSVFSLNGVKSKYVQLFQQFNARTIVVEPGRVGLGLSGIDYYSDYEFNAGLYNVKLYRDTTLIYEKRMDTFSFDNWRCINAHLDYEVMKTKGAKIEKCFRDDGNKSEIYYHLKDDGVIRVAPNQTVKIKLVVSDHAGNTIVNTFYLKGGAPKKINPPKYNCVPGTVQNLSTYKGKLIIPPGAVYDTCWFSFYHDTTYKRYSYKYVVGVNTLPLQKEVELKIMPLFIPKAGASKLYIKSANGAAGGMLHEDGYIMAKTKVCGTYFIDLDTLGPTISGVNIPGSKNITNNTTLKFIIYDTQSGIKRFKATANGHYVLFSHDQKYNMITCNLSETDLAGKIDFELMVEDNCGNIRRYKSALIRN